MVDSRSGTRAGSFVARLAAYAPNRKLCCSFLVAPVRPVHGHEATMHALEQRATHPRNRHTRDSQTSQQFNVHSIPCSSCWSMARSRSQVGATSIQDLEQMFEKAKDVVCNSIISAASRQIQASRREGQTGTLQLSSSATWPNTIPLNRYQSTTGS